MHPKQRLENHYLEQRRVQFDFSHTPEHWIYDNPFATHLINAVHLILPVGELWMCRSFNEALPYVTDEKLRADVKGFVHQEAHHASAHKVAQDYLRHYGYEIDDFIASLDTISKQLNTAPLGLALPQNLAYRWLTIRVGIAAAVEHFTTMLGTWCLDDQPWQNKTADEMMSDLMTWHLAEEVEHRSVAFELYMHLCGEENKTFAYLQRQMIMLAVAPGFTFAIYQCFKKLAQQDAQAKRYQNYGLLRSLAQTAIENARSKQVPSFFSMIFSLRHWLKPGYHPFYEGDTFKALQVIDNSPAVKALTQLRVC
ncbi:metal-dependent hydrolase [Acinetobacter higginsii]|uniref:metal-dependent hydrolase n=1 Tax=Acinetobacter higginsii TaxID=70347 RepID=UPI00267680EA|nr:metal-dependent hydrolase [Acinetobacter higginsii]MDO3666041.1 metal-dependent hydrolase [Acinetobacter higginsii]